MGWRIHATALPEGRLAKIGVTLMLIIPTLRFSNLHVVEPLHHRQRKDKYRDLIFVHLDSIKKFVSDCQNSVIGRISRQDFQSWFLLRMDVATSTFEQIFNTEIQQA